MEGGEDSKDPYAGANGELEAQGPLVGSDWHAIACLRLSLCGNCAYGSNTACGGLFSASEDPGTLV